MGSAPPHRAVCAAVAEADGRGNIAFHIEPYTRLRCPDSPIFSSRRNPPGTADARLFENRGRVLAERTFFVVREGQGRLKPQLLLAGWLPRGAPPRVTARRTGVLSRATLFPAASRCPPSSRATRRGSATSQPPRSFSQHVIGVSRVTPSVGNVTFDGTGANEDLSLEQIPDNSDVAAGGDGAQRRRGPASRFVRGRGAAGSPSAPRSPAPPGAPELPSGRSIPTFEFPRDGAEAIDARLSRSQRECFAERPECSYLSSL
jgi:hypothetical protein